MIGNRRSSTAAAAVGAVALVAVLSGCAGGTTTPPAPSSVTTAAPTTTAVTTPAGAYTEAQVQKLCTSMEAELQNWRTVTPTLGKGGLNILVGTWATENGVNILELAQNRESIDAAMTVTCPDVRAGAISALEIPDLASGMIGF